MHRTELAYICVTELCTVGKMENHMRMLVKRIILLKEPVAAFHPQMGNHHQPIQHKP
ncbi:hypothetical protein D3C72_1893050 [compost metagenome]